MGKVIIRLEDELLCEINIKVSEMYTICSEENTWKIRVGLFRQSPHFLPL
jgi:hypothetical protein